MRSHRRWASRVSTNWRWTCHWGWFIGTSSHANALVGRIYLLSNGTEATAPGETPMREMQPSGAAQAELVICNQTIEYGFKQAKDELGWADFRLTDAASIERWWELVLCAYLFVSLQTPVLAAGAASAAPPLRVGTPTPQHPAW